MGFLSTLNTLSQTVSPKVQQPNAIQMAVRAPPPPTTWLTGICDCAQPMSLLCQTLWCPCCTQAVNHMVVEGVVAEYPEEACQLPQGVSLCDCLCATACCTEYYNRRRLRELVNIQDTVDNDCMYTLFCPVCSSLQIARELRLRKVRITPVGRSPNPSAWSTSLFACADYGCCTSGTCGTCLCPFLQLALNWGKLYGRVELSASALCCCCCGLPEGLEGCDVCCGVFCPSRVYFNRRRIRMISNIAGDPCQDACTACLCLPLAICQNAREISNRHQDVKLSKQYMETASAPPPPEAML